MRSYERIHPGKIVSTLLYERRITLTQFSEWIKVDPGKISNFFAGNVNVTPEFAEKISEALGSNAQFWMMLQERFDNRKAEEQKMKEAKGIPFTFAFFTRKDTPEMYQLTDEDLEWDRMKPRGREVLD
ncbi:MULTISPECIES: HigA family addiction module antitoxin [Pantoea]|nr:MULTISPECIES: HigA family addiction module antitoxin [Pantoea]